MTATTKLIHAAKRAEFALTFAANLSDDPVRREQFKRLAKALQDAAFDLNADAYLAADFGMEDWIMAVVGGDTNAELLPRVEDVFADLELEPCRTTTGT